MAATIEVTSVGGGSCPEVEANLKGLVLQRPDGAQLGFGDMLLRNDAWGC